jgi:uncharacterized membrane protein YjgN (DUF898 family)
LKTDIQTHPVQFHGHEGQYFRIWIVNVLLGIVTLGLYTPWARRRTVQYFYQSTEMAEASFEFTAPIRRMVVGFLLFGGLYLAWSLASNSENEQTQMIGGVIMILAALAVPWLWASAMRFRLGHTRWRGLRLRFAPGALELYLASWPVLAVLVLAFAVGLSAAAVRAFGPLLVVAIVVMALVLQLLCLALLQYNYSRLLVLRTHVGAQEGRWKVELGPYLRIALQAVGLIVLLVGTVLLVGVLLMYFLYAGKSPSALSNLLDRTVLMSIGWVVGLGVMAALWFLAIVPALAWREARTFHLMWNHTGVSQIARFRCDLKAGAFVALRVRNAFLNLLTLGLYRPFARVKVYRMKCESVTLHLRGSVEALAGSLARQQEEGGFGDALADGLGLDIVGA